jgi:hypothetical protein
VLLGVIGYMLWSITGKSIGLVSSDINGAVGSLGGQLITMLFVMAGAAADRGHRPADPDHPPAEPASHDQAGGARRA